MDEQKPPEPIKEHGVPEETLDDEPKGMPNSDRHHTEITPAKHDQDNAAKDE